MKSNSKIPDEFIRIRSALESVVPPKARIRFVCREGLHAVFDVAGQRVRTRWIPAGWPSRIRNMLHEGHHPDLIVTPKMSPGARDLLNQESIGWIDELGGAEFAIGTIVVSRTGRAEPATPRSQRWSASVQAVAEALLCGTDATVEAVEEATGLSAGACTNALRTLTDAGLLVRAAARGRLSARRVKDEDKLLEAYTAATSVAAKSRAGKLALEVGAAWRDVLEGITTAGKAWDKQGIAWVATGAAAAMAMAPTMTTLGSAVVYVAGDTLAELEVVARRVGLRPIDGGRLTLKPFPTAAVQRLATVIKGLRVAPWPRVYADLRAVGVRGEDAADHLLEMIRAG
jgi:hypothetical protein